MSLDILVQRCYSIVAAKQALHECEPGMAHYAQSYLHKLIDEFYRDHGLELTLLGIHPNWHDTPAFAKFITQIKESK